MTSFKEYFETPNDLWIDSIPEEPYDPCPCGCGMKWRFVVKGGEKVIADHEKRFIEKMKEQSHE